MGRKDLDRGGYPGSSASSSNGVAYAEEPGEDQGWDLMVGSRGLGGGCVQQGLAQVGKAGKITVRVFNAFYKIACTVTVDHSHGLFDHEVLPVAGWLDGFYGGGVWRINGMTGEAIRICGELVTCSEGALVCPANETKYGPWVGYQIAPGGTIARWI